MEDYRQIRTELFQDMIRTLGKLSDCRQLTAEKRWKVTQEYRKKLANINIESTPDLSEYVGEADGRSGDVGSGSG